MTARRHAHISGQVSAQSVPQASSKTQKGNSLAPQTTIEPRTMDPEHIAARKPMTEKILRLIQKVSSSDWDGKLPEIVRNMEEHTFRTASKATYMNLLRDDRPLESILKTLISTNQLTQFAPSPTRTMLIPTPDMAKKGKTKTVISGGIEIPNIAAVNTAAMTQTTAITEDFPPSTNALADAGNKSSYSFSNGSTSNGHKRQVTNFGQSGGSSLVSSCNVPRQLTQMIPTLGFTKPQISINSECSTGASFSNTESAIVPTPQQHKKYIESQDNHHLDNLGGQVSSETRSNMKQNFPSYGFSDGTTSGDLGLIRSNMQLNASATSEGFRNAPANGISSKPLQHQLDQQHHKSRLPTPFSQQMLTSTTDCRSIMDTEMAGSEQHHKSRLPSSESFQTSGSSVKNNLTSVSLHKSRTNSDMLNQQASLQSLQQSSSIRSQVVDHQQKINFQSSHSTNEYVLHSQQQMQQFHQQSNQSYTEFVQNSHQLQGQQKGLRSQRYMSANNILRRPPSTSNFGDHMPPPNTLVTQSEILPPQSSQQVHHPDLQSLYCQNAIAADHCKDVQFLGQLPAQDFPNHVSEGSQQLFQLHRVPDEFASNVGAFPNGSQTDKLLRAQWHSQPRQKSQMLCNSLNELTMEDMQSILGQEEGQHPYNPLEGSISSSAAALSHYTTEELQNYHKQCRWLLFLYHARTCAFPKGQCKERNCSIAQELVMHMLNCNDESCRFKFCSTSKKVINHHINCEDACCPVCAPVRKRIAANHNALSDTVSLNEIKTDTSNLVGIIPMETTDDWQPSSKRMKVRHTSCSQVPKNETSPPDAPLESQPCAISDAQPHECEQVDMVICDKSDVADVNIDQSIISGRESLPVTQSSVSANTPFAKHDSYSLVSDYTSYHVKDEIVVVEKGIDQPGFEVKQETRGSRVDQMTSSRSVKPSIKGVSLTELFTPEQIREHIVGLRRWVGQSKAKAEKNQAMKHFMSENSCQLCAVEKLTFEPPPIYCSPCGSRIKRNAMYYTTASGETRYYFCIPCCNEVRGDSVEVDGSKFPKERLKKKKNDEETEEWWVQCDKCEAWQHQICALFNGRRNHGGQAEYTCPNCYIQEVERGERKPLPQSAVLGAKDLPRTNLSDHIEQRLFRRLKQERSERARYLGKNYGEVQGAEGLVVRVVSSVDKKLEVKQCFLELFQQDNYPKEFSYKSKAVLLFQKIEGVEVCLFGMYVQEFGSECAFPNQRRVYLSYLDSVKYFRPEIKTVTGEALRTFVYHEILIGYLEYCKKRGFSSCYIWACPPLKGEDYILYCHPETQKTPKSDKLREWYLSMLRKAAKENIAVELTNLYDHFFVKTGECKASVTAARLPYFDGDYWPGAAEDMINQLCQEEDSQKHEKKGKTKKSLTKRKASGQSEFSGNASKDSFLMHKLGETISPMKEDFIMVHLQHCCNHCCILMVSGARWVCNKCKNFQLCDKCYEVEQRVEDTQRHPIHSREKHLLYPVEINNVNLDTKNKDDILESEFFDTRQAFLSLCQGNHYQYETLRRAKHSSMMVLYHLHNPTAPAYVTLCHVCHHDIETGQGWRCKTCPDFDVCNACYQKGSIDHPHKLTNHPSTADCDAQNKEARQKRVLQFRKMLDLLIHASQCRFPHCQYPNCRKVKSLFRHGIQCKTRASGGCNLCKRMWYLLQIHARACKESECSVPRCRDLKEHLRRLQQQSDSRRRAAVMEMMRERAAKAAGNHG